MSAEHEDLTRGHTPLLPGAAKAAYLDIDDTVRRTYGCAKQGWQLLWRLAGWRCLRPASARPVLGGLRA
jgi:hypothetical protein